MRYLRLSLTILVSAVVLISSGCSLIGYGAYGGGPTAPGGEGTVDNYGPGAFSQPAANLSSEEQARFRIGDVFFTEEWVAAPGDNAERDGLGPTYLATSCAACHPADGRSSAPGTSGDAGRPILRFVDREGANTVLGAYHAQVQTAAVDGVVPEASVSIEWADVSGTYGDGTEYTLRRPLVGVADEAFGELDGLVASGVRVGPQLIGLGLLEAIREEDVLANEDPLDRDGDGISGVANRVHSTALGRETLGRFGHKANVATVADQTAIAYLLDLGITSPLLPSENCPTPQVDCQAAPTGGAPEISAERFDDVVFYTQTLGVPGRPSADDDVIVDGERIFDELGCSGCHVRRWTTGSHDIEAVAEQDIYPYTDLLLHDMGEELSDGRSDGLASGSEWRTPALWGIGLARSVNPAAGFLHDGRARTIEEAVLWHGGEAERAREGFRGLSADDRERVLLFLKSL